MRPLADGRAQIIRKGAFMSDGAPVALEFEFAETRRFEKRLKKLDQGVTRLLATELNKLADRWPSSRQQLRSVHRVALGGAAAGLSSSLRALRLGRGPWLVLLTVDEDPIFGLVEVTLHDIVKHDDLLPTLVGIAQSLYQQELNLAEDEIHVS